MLLHVSEFHSILWLNNVPAYHVAHFVYLLSLGSWTQFQSMWKECFPCHQFLRRQLGQFWYLTRDNVPSYRLRVQSYGTAHFFLPPLQMPSPCHHHYFRCQSKSQVVACASDWLYMLVPTIPSLDFRCQSQIQVVTCTYN